MNFSIRILKPEEFEGALELITQIFPEADPEVCEDDTLLLAESSGLPIGFVHVIEDEEKIVLQGLGVEESIRGHGIGSALVERTIELFSNTDKPVYLKTQLSNPAMELYEKFGFRVKKFGMIHILERRREN
jgi:ribosomal protein S18 acetylase RimI-like enzyme